MTANLIEFEENNHTSLLVQFKLENPQLDIDSNKGQAVYWAIVENNYLENQTEANEAQADAIKEEQDLANAQGEEYLQREQRDIIDTENALAHEYERGKL